MMKMMMTMNSFFITWVGRKLEMMIQIMAMVVSIMVGPFLPVKHSSGFNLSLQASLFCSDLYTPPGYNRATVHKDWRIHYVY